MLTSLGLIFLLGLLMAAVCQRIHLPRIIGILLTGIILGPYVLDLLDVSILNISSELRQIALIIILLKAGLSLDLKDLKKVRGCGSYGSSSGSSVTGSGGATDGASHGEQLWYGEKHSADDSGWGFL